MPGLRVARFRHCQQALQILDSMRRMLLQLRYMRGGVTSLKIVAEVPIGHFDWATRRIKRNREPIELERRSTCRNGRRRRKNRLTKQPKSFDLFLVRYLA